MGAVCCKPEEDDIDDPAFGSARVKSWKRHKWRSEEPLTRSQLKRMRETFWDTEPHYGGDRVIWDTLKAACEADLETARAILEGAGVIVAAADMSICYDERGRKYELPRYAISDPSNLQPDPPTKGGGDSGGGVAGSGGAGSGQLELPAVAAGAGEGGGSGAACSPSSPDSAHLPEDAPLNQVAVRALTALPSSGMAPLAAGTTVRYTVLGSAKPSMELNALMSPSPRFPGNTFMTAMFLRIGLIRFDVRLLPPLPSAPEIWRIYTTVNGCKITGNEVLGNGMQIQYNNGGIGHHGFVKVKSDLMLVSMIQPWRPQRRELAPFLDVNVLLYQHLRLPVQGILGPSYVKAIMSRGGASAAASAADGAPLTVPLSADATTF